MIDTNTLTCVYTIHDKEAFSEERERLMQNFKQSDGEPWAITAISLGHEIHRLALVEEAHSEGRHDLLDDIFGMIDPSSIDELNEMEGY